MICRIHRFDCVVDQDIYFALFHLPHQNFGAHLVHRRQGKQAVERFNHGDPGTQSGQDTGQFTADDAASDDNHGFRDGLQAQRLIAGKDILTVDPVDAE